MFVAMKLSWLCRVIQKQMAFMLGRHGMFLELNEDVEDYEDLTEIMSNVQLNSNFLALAREVRTTQNTRDSAFC